MKTRCQKFFKRKPQAVSGFTLVETLVAIAILVASIAGPMTIASQGLSSALTANQQVTATFLAQDALEYIRWVRDTNKLVGNGWLAFMSACTGVDGCYLDTTQAPDASGNMVQCLSGVCPPLRYDVTTGFYSYDSTDPVSIFTRRVLVAFPVGGNDCGAGNGCEAALTVTVSWQTGARSHSITVRQNIFDWQ